MYTHVHDFSSTLPDKNTFKLFLSTLEKQHFCDFVQRSPEHFSPLIIVATAKVSFSIAKIIKNTLLGQI